VTTGVAHRHSRGPTIEISSWQRLKQNFADAFSEQFEYRRNDGDAMGLDRQSRKRGRDAYRYVLLLLAFILTPMLVYNLYTGEHLLSAVCFGLLSILAVNIGLLSRQRQAFLSPGTLLLSGILLILLAVALGQNFSLFWLYPLLAGLPVLLRSGRARVVGLLAAAIAIPLAFMQFDSRTATVISFSMALTWLVTAWLVFAAAEQSRRLKDMAITDPLTGAYNRRYLEEQARLAIESWRRHWRPASILLVDIDHFKRINDRYGHAAGDIAIKRLVEVISARLRSVDTLCRFGGEEFVVLLNDTGIEGATRIAEELRVLVEETDFLDEGSMTISIGVCEVIAADNLDHWYNLADTALYMAKRKGRNRVEVATAAMVREPVGRTVPDWR